MPKVITAHDWMLGNKPMAKYWPVNKAATKFTRSLFKLVIYQSNAEGHKVSINFAAGIISKTRSVHKGTFICGVARIKIKPIKLKIQGLFAQQGIFPFDWLLIYIVSP